ncbi:MAG: DNA polymerase III subunit delta [Bacteroidota bacterium]|nr:DNA polymerase III subunit delta [Bacteroidota bacterium]
MQFKDIIGQQQVKQRLIQSVAENRIAHAQLLLGPEGSGTLALAIAYAQYINCQNRTSEDSCGVCSSCNKFQKLIHPDLHFVFPVATNKTITKDPVSDDFIAQWRTLLLKSPYFSLFQWYGEIDLENKQGNISKNESQEIIRKLNLKTFEAEYKAMIIWLPERMNIIAANKLLKMLEEPPEKTVFLLVSENTGLMLQTILSRTQLIKVPKINDDDLLAYLKQQYNLPEQQLLDIVHLSDGSYITALRVMESDEENGFNLDRFISLMRLCWTKDVLGLLKWCETVTGIGRERQKSFLTYTLRMLRENFVMNCQVPELALLTQKENEFSSKFFPYINQDNIFRMVEELNKAQYHIEANGSDKIIFLDLSLKLIKLIKK